LPDNLTANKLLEFVGRGTTNIETVTSLARTMQADGFHAKSLAALGSCGANGVHNGNSERDLHRWVRGAWGFELEPYEITLKLHVAWCCTSMIFNQEMYSKWS